MVNPGILLLVLLVIGLTITVIALLIWAAYSSQQQEATIQESCSNVIDPSQLLQISSDWEYCTTGDATQGTLYYIGCTGDRSLNFVVSPTPQSPLNVCISYCDRYTPPPSGTTGFGTCTGPDYNNKSAQDNFNTCMSQLNPTNCIPPLPLAVNGTTLYYAYSATPRVCGQCINDCYINCQCQAQCTPTTCNQPCSQIS
jgi:hypothetical protein